jgi:hypothetical protein
LLLLLFNSNKLLWLLLQVIQLEVAQLDHGSPGAVAATALVFLLLLLLPAPAAAAAATASACCALLPIVCLPLRRLPFPSVKSSTAAMPVAAATPAATAELLLMPLTAELQALLMLELTESNHDWLLLLLLLLVLLVAALLNSEAASGSAEDSSASSCCCVLLGCLQRHTIQAICSSTVGSGNRVNSESRSGWSSAVNCKSKQA